MYVHVKLIWRTAGVTGKFALLMGVKRLISGVNLPSRRRGYRAQPDGHGVDSGTGHPGR